MLHDEGQDESSELLPDQAMLHAFDDGIYFVTETGALPLADHPELLDELRDCCVRYAEHGQTHRLHANDAPTGEGLFRPAEDGSTLWFVEGHTTVPIQANPELYRQLIERCRRYAEVIGLHDPE